MGKEKIILTGDRPTGRLHIGHYVGSHALCRDFLNRQATTLQRSTPRRRTCGNSAVRLRATSDSSRGSI